MSNLNKEFKKYLEDVENNQNEYDFEIVCPYCENEFLIDLKQKNFECPKCNNLIELDWTGNMEEEQEQKSNGCAGKCSGCKGCEGLNIDEDDDM